jgi:hypothetical protein
MAFTDEQSALRISADIIPDTIGHAIVREGLNERGESAVAVWHLTATGQPCGAWTVSTDSLADDPAAASLLLGLCTGRPLLAWDAGPARKTLVQLAEWAGAEAPSRPEVLLSQVLAEVAEHRAAYDAAIEEHRSTVKTKVEALAWQREIPQATSWAEFVQDARVRSPKAISPLAVDVLHLARAAVWVADLWRDTETVRTRRRYLLDRFGPAAPLPPGWLATLTTAYRIGA